MAGAVGRPRKNSPRRRGNTAREEILDASAELFTTRGFATTSTHQIADAVGIRQASLYYHFPSKTEIFLTLLKSTAETHLLLSTRWNVGRLYQLPIVASEEFAEFHAQRHELKNTYRTLAAEIVGADDPRLDLPFHIAQTVTDMRDNTGTAPYPADGALPETAIMLADAALTVIGAPLPDDRIERTRELLSS